MYEQKPHVCEICLETFICGEDFQKHFLTHRDETSYTSYTYEFHDKVVSQLEELEEDSEVKPYICEVYSTAFTGEADFESHLRTHQKEKTFVSSSEAFTPLDHFNAHLMTQAKKALTGKEDFESQLWTHEKTFVSSSEAFTPLDHLNAHLMRQTKKKSCYKRKKNDKREETFYNIKGVAHKKGKPYTCEVCDKGFYCERSLKTHRWVHINKKWFVCNCSESYSTQGKLKKHMVTHMIKKECISDTVSSEKEDKWYVCTLCEGEFLGLGKVNYHLLGAHTRVLPYICKKCNRTFSYADLESFKHHLRAHEEGKTFVFSSDSYTSQDNLNEQLLSHTEEKDYRSGNLNAIHGTIFNFRRRFLKHGLKQEKERICEVCSLKFPCKRRLHNHFRTHMNEKRFVCNVCNEAYSCRQKIKEHVMKHMIEKECVSGTASSDQSQRDDKPYVCGMCKEEFSGLGKVNNHLLRIHTRVLQYICHICSEKYAYTDLKGFRHHLQTHNQ